MRKFAATSHQRLIHQLRGELQNDQVAPQLPATVAETDVAPRVNASSQGQEQEKRPRSFRERLNAIDMR